MDALELIERTVTQLTGQPAKVSYEEDEHGAVFEIFSPKFSNGSLVGKNRSTIEALRVLAKAIGYNNKHRIKIVLRERGEK